MGFVAAGVAIALASAATALAASPSFAPGTTYFVAGDPYSITAADLNGDGKPDLATANGPANNVTIRLGNGLGGFSEAVGSPLAVGANPHAVVASDLNGDGKLDLAVANYDSHNVSILLGNGAGGFSPAVGSPIAVGGAPRSLAVSDLNGDGKLDLAVPNVLSDNVLILLGDGTGQFSTAPGSPFAVGSFPTAVVASDFNGDGKPDLAVTSFVASDVEIFIGNGVGGFTPAASYPIEGSAVFSVAVADLNRDGRPDLAVANAGYPVTGVTILLGDGSGGFSAAPISHIAIVPGGPRSVAIADLDSDGKLDLITANYNGNFIAFLVGDGAGGFVAPAGSHIADDGGPISVAVADLNGDGKPDLAFADNSGDRVTILLNTTPDSTPPNVTVPHDLAVEATGPGGRVVSYGATAADNVDGSITPTCNPPSGSTFPVGVTSVTCSATDKAGNTGSAAIAVSVVDTTAPSLSLPPPLASEATSGAGAIVTFSAFATDLVDGTIAPLCSPASGSVFALGDTTVTCVATDAHDNSVSGSFSVKVGDTMPPVLSLTLSVFRQAPSTVGAPVPFTASAADAVDGAVSVACNPASGSVFPIGTTSVTCSASDSAGNSISGSFPVAVAVAVLTSMPPAVSTSQTAAVAWSSLIPFTTFVCSFDGGAFAPCSTPRTYRGLAAGAHTFCVQATTDVVPSCSTWLIVGPGAPDTSINSLSKVSHDVTLSFSADQPGVVFTCQVDGGSLKTNCSSGTTWHGMASGTHTFKIWATNFAGQTDPTPAVRTIAV